MKRLAFVLLGTAVCAVAALACQETPGTEFPIEPGGGATGVARIPNPGVDAGPGVIDALGDGGPFDGPFGNDGGTIFQDGPGPTP
jgi:hypothetical protein